MEVCGQLHAPAGLPSGKEHQYPLDIKLGGSQSSEMWWWREKTPTPGGNWSLVIQLVA